MSDVNDPTAPFPERGDDSIDAPGSSAAAQYFQTPSLTGTTASLPSVGATASTDIWMAVWEPGEDATHPTFVKIVSAGQVFNGVGDTETNQK